MSFVGIYDLLFNLVGFMKLTKKELNLLPYLISIPLPGLSCDYLITSSVGEGELSFEVSLLFYMEVGPGIMSVTYWLS